MSIACSICYPKATTSNFNRCQEHRHCDKCGRIDSLYTTRQGLFCPDCWRDYLRHRIATFNGKTRHTSIPICPYCGKQDNDWWDRSDLSPDTDIQVTCDLCESDYIFAYQVKYTFTTYKETKARQ